MTRSVELHASTKVRVRMVVTHVVDFCVRAEVEAQRPEQDPPALDAPASQLGAEIGAEEGGEGADQQVHGVGQAKTRGGHSFEILEEVGGLERGSGGGAGRAAARLKASGEALWQRAIPICHGAGCRVHRQGAGCRVQGAGCGVQGAGCRVQGASLSNASTCRVRPTR